MAGRATSFDAERTLPNWPHSATNWRDGGRRVRAHALRTVTLCWCFPAPVLPHLFTYRRRLRLRYNLHLPAPLLRRTAAHGSGGLDGAIPSCRTHYWPDAAPAAAPIPTCPAAFKHQASGRSSTLSLPILPIHLIAFQHMALAPAAWRHTGADIAVVWWRLFAGLRHSHYFLTACAYQQHLPVPLFFRTRTKHTALFFCCITRIRISSSPASSRTLLRQRMYRRVPGNRLPPAHKTYRCTPT